MAKKYYAVKSGRKTGVFDTWDECKRQIQGYSGAIYKGFTSYEDACDFVNGQVKKLAPCGESLNQVKAYVDGSYSKEQHKYSYGCVILHDGETIELSGVGTNGEYADMRNVAGELLGSMKAIKWARDNECKSIIIYHDYEGIERWANGSWRANKEGTKKYVEFIKKYREYLDIHFEKVLAHSGDFYNEEADRLAKQALLRDTSEIKGAKDEKNGSKNLDERIEIFKRTMNAEDKTKNSISFIFKNHIISESKLKKFVKEVWSLEGNDKDEIDIIKLNFDIQNSKMEWSITDTQGDSHCFEMNI